jgi:surface-anchored protein
VGVGAGEPFWYLSETPIDGAPWFGIASDLSPAGGIPIGVFGEYLTLALSIAPPPGAALSAWASVDDPEAPPFLFSTAIHRHQAQVVTGSHAHLSWAFTRAGTYLVDATITGTRNGSGEKVSSRPVTYRFIVE